VVAATEKEFRLDGLKWLVVLLLVGGGIWANWYFGGEPVLYRALGMVLLVALSAAIAYHTAKGAAFWKLLRGAQQEVRRVVWPTRQERNQTTLIVFAVVLIMALILWGLDTLFGWIASMIIG